MKQEIKNPRVTPVFWVLLLWPLLLPAQGARPSSLPAAPPIAGAPWIQNFTPEAYGAHNQNWAITQDKRGVVYAGNSHGLLEYDGVSWRMIASYSGSRNKRLVRSLATSAQGRIFVGGYGEIGYLAPDVAGQMQYVSLLGHMEEAQRDFADVWSTVATPEGIFFSTSRYLFRWDGQRMQAWPAKSAFAGAYWARGQLYVYDTDAGLMHFAAGTLRPVPWGDGLDHVAVSAVLPWGADGDTAHLLIVTRDQGIFSYDGTALKRLATQADDLLQREQITCAARLSNGLYALGTMRSGVLVLGAAAELWQHIGQRSGLQNDAVLALYEDRQRGLWMGMQVGIARAETGSPFSYYDGRAGIEGSVWQVLRHQGQLYCASIMGLFRLGEEAGAAKGFTLVPGVSPQCWAVLSVGQALLAGTFDGVYEVKQGSGRRISQAAAFSLHRSQQDTNRVWVGMRSGVRSLYYTGGRWRDEGQWEGIDEEVRHFYEAADGTLWLTDYYTGLLRVRFPQGYTMKPTVARYGTQHGLPPADKVIAFPTDKGLRFATIKGVLAFDEAQQRFWPDTALARGLASAHIGLFDVAKEPGGNLWMVADDNAQSGLARRRAGGGYDWDTSPFLRIAKLPVFTVYPDPAQAGVAWMGANGQVLRYDSAMHSAQGKGYPALIRKVVANGDSLLYGGAEHEAAAPLRLAYALNSLRFSFAAPSYDGASANEYQYMLEGYDDWSAWSAETYKDYTRISPGKYRFLVRARDVYGHIGDTAAIGFVVLPPFYLTWWAYALYLLCLIALMAGLWRYAAARVQKRHQQEIEQLEYEKLKELDSLKSRFFADISHEFRTPLTLILGALDRDVPAKSPDEPAPMPGLIKRSALHLLRLVNQLLDLSKLEAGRMELNLSRGDVVPMLRGIAFSFESLAQQKGIGLRFESKVAEAILDADPERLSQILGNVLSNALKFTPPGGSVSVELDNDGTGQYLQVAVADTGQGIFESHLPHIFDRFYQGERSTHTREAGTGIGLALTKELVSLHRGRISATSTEGQGTRFVILLPYASHPAPQAQPPYPTLVTHHLHHMADYSSAAPPQTVVAPDSPDHEKLLLLIEDQPDMRAFIRSTLSGTYRVLEAADGTQGMAMAFEHMPDIIVSDVVMPGMDGLELCHTLKSDERTSHIPIVLLTGLAQAQDRMAGLRQGADTYLSKPFAAQELLLTIANLTHLRDTLRQRYTTVSPQASAVASEPEFVLEDKFYRKIIDFFEANIADPDLGMEQLYRHLHMSHTQLHRKLLSLSGKTPLQLLRDMRLKKAEALLKDPTFNVSDVAWACGFNDPSYFTRIFTREYGITPSAWRQEGTKE